MITDVLLNYLTSLTTASVKDATVYNLRKANNISYMLSRTFTRSCTIDLLCPLAYKLETILNIN